MCIPDEYYRQAVRERERGKMERERERELSYVSIWFSLTAFPSMIHSMWSVSSMKLFAIYKIVGSSPSILL